jgi:hypothetical protein
VSPGFEKELEELTVTQEPAETGSGGRKVISPLEASLNSAGPTWMRTGLDAPLMKCTTWL